MSKTIDNLVNGASFERLLEPDGSKVCLSATVETDQFRKFSICRLGC